MSWALHGVAASAAATGADRYRAILQAAGAPVAAHVKGAPWSSGLDRRALTRL
jgi:hypothetical protein